MRCRYSSPWLLTPLAFVLLQLFGCSVLVPRHERSEVTPAIARERLIGFHYQARRTQYTCTGLGTKLSTMLRAVGVRETRPMEFGCSGDAPMRRIDVRIHAAVLLEATPANLLAATQYTAAERLLARIQARELPAASELPQVRASWTRVHLSTHRTRGLDPGDCELIEAFRDQLLPVLGLRPVASSLSCENAAAGKMEHRISVVALLPLGEQP